MSRSARPVVAFGSALTFLIALLLAAPAMGQSMEQRIAQVRRQRLADRAAAATQAQRAHVTITARLAQILGAVTLDRIPAKLALQWWTQRTGISLVIDWRDLAKDGVRSDAPVSLKVQHIPAATALHLILTQAAPDLTLIYHATPWYVEVMSKREANRHPVVRLYDVRGLLMPIPDFAGPSFDLQSTLGNENGTSAGTSGGGASGGVVGAGLWGQAGQNRADKPKIETPQQRGEKLAQLIRDTIEPTIWRTNGGQYSSIRYHNGLLIVQAPLYVQQQIGIPMPPPAPGSPGHAAAGYARPIDRSGNTYRASGATSRGGAISGGGGRSNGVAGVADTPDRIASVAER